MSDRGETGRMGEELALRFLLNEGLSLLEKNWRCGHMELDLIMESRRGLEREKVLHIVEVRSLKEPYTKEPFESVGYRKRMSVMKAARCYVAGCRDEYNVQFDVVSVVFSVEGECRLDYFPDAFSPTW
jgi:putative endonuclease